jgi:hypothetical protein
LLAPKSRISIQDGLLVAQRCHTKIEKIFCANLQEIIFLEISQGFSLSLFSEMTIKDVFFRIKRCNPL